MSEPKLKCGCCKQWTRHGVTNIGNCFVKSYPDHTERWHICDEYPGVQQDPRGDKLRLKMEFADLTREIDEIKKRVERLAAYTDPNSFSKR